MYTKDDFPPRDLEDTLCASFALCFFENSCFGLSLAVSFLYIYVLEVVT